MSYSKTSLIKQSKIKISHITLNYELDDYKLI